MFDVTAKNISKQECSRSNPGEGKNSALILVSFPHQLLHAISALRYDRLLHGIPEDESATILVWSHQASQHAPRSPVRAIFRQAMESFPWITLWFPCKFQRLYFFSPYRRLIDRASWFRRQLKPEEYSAFYYAQDVSADHTAQAIMQALPEVRRICYGDTPGFLYPAFGSLLHNSKSHSTTFKQRVWKSRLHGMQNWLSATESIIAVDFRSPKDGVKLPDVHILPCSLLLETLQRLKSGFPHIALVESSLSNEWSANKSTPFLLLLSNFSDSGMTTRQSELALYTDICQSHVSLGGTIYIKPHIGTDQKFISQLIAKLAAYQAVLLPTVTQQLPVEFFPKLLAQSNVLSVSSSSALVAWLFKHYVTHALTEDRIHRFFKLDYILYMSKANRAIVEKVSAAEIQAVPGKYRDAADG